MLNRKIDKYLALAMLFALLNMGAIFFVFGFQQYSDSEDYFQAIHWLRGESAHVELSRILRPLGPALAAPFEFLGEGAGLVVQNILFYLLSAFLIFKIVELIFQNRRQGTIAVMLWVTATPIIDSGLAYLTDMGAWFFYLLSIFLILLYFFRERVSLSGEILLIAGFFSGAGVLMKENGGLGILFFGMMVLLTREFDWRAKATKLLKFDLAFLLPIILLQIVVYKYFHYTSLDWYLSNTAGAEGESIFLITVRYLAQLFRILGFVWPFILWGLWLEWREKNWQRLKIYLALLPASFSFLLWTVGGGGRAAFIFAPLGILLASYALKKRGAFFLSALLSLILVINYLFVWFNQQIPFVDALYNVIF